VCAKLSFYVRNVVFCVQNKGLSVQAQQVLKLFRVANYVLCVANEVVQLFCVAS